MRKGASLWWSKIKRSKVPKELTCKIVSSPSSSSKSDRQSQTNGRPRATAQRKMQSGSLIHPASMQFSPWANLSKPITRSLTRVTCNWPGHNSRRTPSTPLQRRVRQAGTTRTVQPVGGTPIEGKCPSSRSRCARARTRETRTSGARLKTWTFLKRMSTMKMI